MALSDKEAIRIRETVQMVSPAISSLLEVGCGDGRVSEFFPAKIRKTGFDLDVQKLKNFPGHKIRADVANIPVKTNAFDLVLTTEVLEHLDDQLFAAARAELARVAKRYVLISVPFNETLGANQEKCSGCGHAYHAWGHVRKFNAAVLKDLFENTTLIRSRFLSPKETRIPSLFYMMVRKFGHRWGADPEHPRPCPRCGSAPLNREGNWFGKIFIRLLWRFEKYSPFKKPIWIACLYEKNIH